MKQKYKRFSSIFMNCVCVLAVVAIAVGTGYSLAFFSHSVTTEPQTLSFGKIEITEGSNAAKVSLGAVIPGETKNANSDMSNKPNNTTSLVSFKPTTESLPCYLRVKIGIECENVTDGNMAQVEEFMNGLTIGSNLDTNIVLAFCENSLSSVSCVWVKVDDYYYLVTKATESSSSKNLQPVAAGETAHFLKSVTFPKNLSNTVEVNGTTYTNVQSGLTFRFNIVCQAIQSAHVSSTLADEVKNIFNSIV